MADKVMLTVGTKRGLFFLESDKSRRKWKTRGPFLKGWIVHHSFIDTRGTPRLHAAAESFTFGSNAFSGDVAGRKIDAAQKAPAVPDLNPKATKFSEKYGLDKAKRLWIVAPGPAKDKKVLYAGTAPAGLFRSEDLGKSWQPVDGINKHPTRKEWSPGAGGQSLHSIQIDPRDSNRMYVAISAAGSFRTDDGAKTWKPINAEVASYVGAPKKSEVGT